MAVQRGLDDRALEGEERAEDDVPALAERFVPLPEPEGHHDVQLRAYLTAQEPIGRVDPNAACGEPVTEELETRAKVLAHAACVAGVEQHVPIEVGRGRIDAE